MGTGEGTLVGKVTGEGGPAAGTEERGTDTHTRARQMHANARMCARRKNWRS